MTRKANRLAQETSPYLLMHAYNPVDWFPWGVEAFQKARSEDKPIFLSIGYSACHWCHVMEHESFEDLQAAKVLNDHFVSIKVDREERPDLDDLYMSAVQTLTGRGGWPMSVWLTPDLRPFYAGTYIPPTPRYGMPGFTDLLERITLLWKERRSEILGESLHLADHLRDMAVLNTGTEPPGPGMFLEALDALRRSFDVRWGGFGGAPKFPPVLSLELILRKGDPEDLVMVTRTLDAMGEGGMYDHLGGGFARYSVDEKWLIPHFEKMLYDNGQLASSYLSAHLATGNPRYAAVAKETLDYLLGDMQDPAGGFYSSEDADSEGEEGRFYVFTPAEVTSVLGEDDGAAFCKVFGITGDGNFEGRNVLNRIALPPSHGEVREDQVDRWKAQLRAVRGSRPRPPRDEKILTSWNGLALSAFARGFQVLDETAFLDAATVCAEFIQAELWLQGGLLRTWRRGRAHTSAFLEDHAALILGLVDLYEAGFETRWLRWGEELAEIMRRDFLDEVGGFWSTSPVQTDLLFRQKPIYDGSLPSGNALAIRALLRLAKHLGREDFHRDAERALVTFAPSMETAPRACLGLLVASDLLNAEEQEIVVAGPRDDPGTRALLKAAWAYRKTDQPISLVSTEASLPLHQDRRMVDGKPTAYVCRNQTCLSPVNTPEALKTLLRTSSRAV